MKKALLIVPAAVGLLAAAHWLEPLTASDSTEQDAATRRLADRVMERLKADDFAGMAALLESKVIWPLPVSLETSFKKQRETSALRYGKSLGEVEFVGKEVVGRSFVRYSYLERWERHAVVWRMTFYRSSSEWLCSDVSWDDNVYERFKPAP